MALDANPMRTIRRGRGFHSSSTVNALSTSPAIALPTSSLFRGNAHPTARPVHSPIYAIVTIVFSSNKSQLPTTLAFTPTPAVTASAARFFRRYHVATFTRPGLAIIIRVFGGIFALIEIVGIAFPSPPLFQFRICKATKRTRERGVIPKTKHLSACYN